jgi:hypothetical protein
MGRQFLLSAVITVSIGRLLGGLAVLIGFNEIEVVVSEYAHPPLECLININSLF